MRLRRLRRAFGRLVPRRPRSLAGQMTALLAAALVAASIVSLILLNSERSRFAQEARRGAQVERILSLVPVLERVPRDMREDLARAASTRSLSLSVDARPLLRESGADWISERLAERLRSTLGTPAAQARVDLRPEREQRPERGQRPEREQRPGRGERPERAWWHAGRGGREGGWMGERFGRRPRVLAVDVSVPLEGGSWLNMRQRRRERPQPFVSGAILFTMLLSLIAVLGVSLLFVRRLARPLRGLSDAAALAGAGDRSARAPVTGPAEVRRAAAAFNDMQAEIAAFDAERARTVAAVGHDLRTPITSLRIRAEMLDEDARDPMIRTLDEMRVIAEGLLAWGRDESVLEDTQAVDLSALLADVCDRTGGSVRFAGEAGVVVAGRPVALARAFANIVENAARYAGAGVVRAIHSVDQVIVSVEDEGPGIPPERLGDVLEPFTRLDASRSSETGGAGLGLAIAQTVVRAHGGTLRLQNRAEGGLAVTVSLPRGEAGARRKNG